MKGGEGIRYKSEMDETGNEGMKKRENKGQRRKGRGREKG